MTPQVHDLSEWSPGEVYDRSQCDDSIRDGDVLVAPGGIVLIMAEAWPTHFSRSERSEGSVFHELAPELNFETFKGGHYKASAELARETLRRIDRGEL